MIDDLDFLRYVKPNYFVWINSRTSRYLKDYFKQCFVVWVMNHLQYTIGLFRVYLDRLAIDKIRIKQGFKVTNNMNF